ncbi:MAG: RidA family protein [Sphingomonadales bacterium]|nr:MAG: RidA family protein [Sphingomonadales bacterium]
MSKIVRLERRARSSKVVIYNGIVYLGGNTAEDRTLDIQGQTAQVLASIDRRLRDAGTDKSRLLTAQIWLKEVHRDWKGMNEVWDAWTDPENAPTRATGQVELAHPDILVEIVVTAAAGE